MRFEYHAALHQTQHIREKTLAMVTKLAKCQMKLANMVQEEGKLTATLREAKSLHMDLQKKHSELSYQGGLLFMPSLLHDYDETVDKVNTKKSAIIELKNSIKQMSQRVVELESQCV